MGVKIKALVDPVVRNVPDDYFSGKIVGIDVYNYIYAYISAIQRDGSPLTFNGHVTSHVSGFFYKILEMLEMKIKPVFVLDGTAIDLKSSTLQKRDERRTEMLERARLALESGDKALHDRLASSAMKVNEQVVRDLVPVFEGFGCPVIRAPSDAEAQISYMNRKGMVDATISQDYDSLLFGSNVFGRNFMLAKKRNIGGRTVLLQRQVVRLEDLLTSLKITREMLVDIGLLCGTDFNSGIHGIGPKKALAFIRQFTNVENVAANSGRFSDLFTREVIESMVAARKVFLEPKVDEKPVIKFGMPDKQALVDYMVSLGFSEKRIKSRLTGKQKTYHSSERTIADL